MKFKNQKCVFFCLWGTFFLLPNLPLAQAIDVKFTVEPQEGMTGQVFIFTNTTADVTSTKWEFGDGISVKGSTVQHIYASPKTYTLKLTVKDSNGDESIKSIPVTITSSSSSLQAAVLSPSFVPARGKTEKDVVFANTSAGPADKWIWDFGDGQPIKIPGERNPTHTYESVGDYIVTMVMEAPNGLTKSKTYAVKVPVPPVGGPANAKKPIEKVEDCVNVGAGYSGDLPKWRMFEGEWTVGLAAQAQALKYDFATKKAGVNSGVGAGTSFRFYQDVDVPGVGLKPISEIRTECRMSTWKTQKETWLPKATPLFSITPVIYVSQLTSEDDLAVEPAIMFGVFDDIINAGVGFNLTGQDGEVGDVFLLLSIGAGFNW